MATDALTLGILIVFLGMFTPVFTRVSNRVFGLVLLFGLALIYAGCYALVWK